MIVLVIITLVLDSSSSFIGSDDMVTKIIQSLNPDFKAWFAPIYQPPLEVEILLWATASAIGAFIIGYFIGYTRAGSKGQKK